MELAGPLASVPKDAWVEVDCGLCGGKERDVKLVDGPFSVVTCRACGVTYVTPRLSDRALIEEVYDEGYWTSDAARERGYTDYRADEALYLKTYKRRLSVIRRHFGAPARVLDVGCAAGYFLSVMKDEGWKVTGLEPSDAIRATAAQRVGEENVRAELLGEVDLPSGSFDLVTMWDVIEHIPDPLAAVKEVARLLAPGGKFLIETQNIDSRAARVLGKRWQHFKHTEHIYHFNPRTIADLLQRAGFEVLENRPWLGGKYVSVDFVVERSRLLPAPVALLFQPLRLFSGRTLYVNLFDEMIVVAQPS